MNISFISRPAKGAGSAYIEDLLRLTELPEGRRNVLTVSPAVCNTSPTVIIKTEYLTLSQTKPCKQLPIAKEH